MSHDKAILEKAGCTQERLRLIFTSTDPSKNGGSAKSTGADGGSSPQENLTTAGVQTVPYQGGIDEPKSSEAKKGRPEDWEIRKKFEYRIRSRVLGAIGTGINNFRALQAVDMAWDAPPIQKETIPLMLWAQGKITKHSQLCDALISTCGEETARNFIKKKPDNTVMVDIPRICDISINLVRSYVTRRHAALAALWDNLWPLLKYDPRGSDEVAALVADVMTQRVDIMANEYNYRHFLSQCDRDKLLYAQSLIFPKSAWDRQHGIRWKKTNTGERGDKTEPFITQEGVDFDNPHPSRWGWDLGAPLANINTNNGPRWVSHWGIVTYGTVLEGDYWNRDKVVASEAWTQLIQQYQWYFSQYFQPCVLEYPPLAASADPTLMNDRQGNIGLYTAEMRDKGVLLTQYFEKINPKVEGIGDYDAEIWLRMTAAGDGTVVAAEFMPSIPACYGAINCNDNRVANASLASEMLPYQDMTSNIVTTMIEQVRRSFTQIWVFNRDFLGKEICDELEKNAKNKEWWLDPKVLTMSFSEKQELIGQGRFDPSLITFQITTQLNNAISDALRALAQLLALADRLVNSSPNELGQPNPREVPAREVQEISTSVQSIYAFYNEGPREQRAAVKRLVSESLLCHGQPSFEVPVLGRYRKATVEEAGFKLTRKVEGSPNTLLKSGVRISGKLSDLDYDYVYTSRDGAERASNTQGAQVLQQMFVGMLQIPGVAQKLGPERIFRAMNIIARMAGAPDEFQIALDDGEDETLPDKNEGEMPPEVKAAIDGVMKQMQEFAMGNQQLAGVVAQIAQKIGLPLPVAPQGAPQGPGGGQPPAAPNGASAPQTSGAAILR